MIVGSYHQMQCCGSGQGKTTSRSGQLWIRYRFQVKLLWKTIKFDNFSTKILNLEKESHFFKFPKKHIYHHNMQPNTLTKKGIRR
jgi:hypothetical protein